MTIKLKKTEIGYTAEDTKFLKGICITGCNGRWVVQHENDEIYVYEIFTGLKWVRTFIEEFDAEYELKLAEEAAEEAARKLEWDEYSKAEAAATETFKNVESVKVEVGSMIVGRFATLNKNCALGSYRVECDKPEKDEKNKYWDHNTWKVPANWYDKACKVTDVKVLTESEYDEFAENLMSDREWLEKKGGSESDDPRLEGLDFFRATEEQRNIWYATSYNLVVAVMAPNRETVLIDPQGHNYARYVALLVK